MEERKLISINRRKQKNGVAVTELGSHTHKSAMEKCFEQRNYNAQPANCSILLIAINFHSSDFLILFWSYSGVCFFLSPLTLPCAKFSLWDTDLVHGIPVPYAEWALVFQLANRANSKACSPTSLCMPTEARRTMVSKYCKFSGSKSGDGLQINLKIVILNCHLINYEKF